MNVIAVTTTEEKKKQRRQLNVLEIPLLLFNVAQFSASSPKSLLTLMLLNKTTHGIVKGNEKSAETKELWYRAVGASSHFSMTSSAFTGCSLPSSVPFYMLSQVLLLATKSSILSSTCSSCDCSHCKQFLENLNSFCSPPLQAAIRWNRVAAVYKVIEISYSKQEEEKEQEEEEEEIILGGKSASSYFDLFATTTTTPAAKEEEEKKKKKKSFTTISIGKEEGGFLPTPSTLRIVLVGKTETKQIEVQQNQPPEEEQEEEEQEDEEGTEEGGARSSSSSSSSSCWTEKQVLKILLDQAAVATLLDDQEREDPDVFLCSRVEAHFLRPFEHERDHRSETKREAKEQEGGGEEKEEREKRRDSDDGPRERFFIQSVVLKPSSSSSSSLLLNAILPSLTTLADQEPLTLACVM